MDELNKYLSDDAPVWLKQAVTEALLQAQEKMAKENLTDTSNNNQDAMFEVILPEEPLFAEDDNENVPTKHQLLAKYLDRPVTAFHQYDFFTGSHSGDKFGRGKGGDCLFCVRITHELVHGASVRVLIRPDESKEDVMRALLSIVETINKENIFKNKPEDEEDIPF